MNRYESGLSNLSYTNKDFNAIYTELLDLGDRISPRWKPSQSNESDPGVVMLKMDAIIGDKNHYNIDKNILELFPSSVTQYPAAREIFEQCGYIMPYYQAAEVIISLNMFKEPDEITDTSANSSSPTSDSNKVILEAINRLYTLPDFTAVTNIDNSVVYTIIDSDPFITSNGFTYEYKALEGSIKEYNLNNSNLITYNSLDYNNRLYFKEANVAQNGIFIQNVRNGEDIRNYSDWIKVDNLMTEPQGLPCYKFGVSKDGAKCYIEFPNDIANLIGEGLKINYITTSGYNGNISKNTLTNFFGDVSSYVSDAATTQANIDSRYDSALIDDQGSAKKITLTSDNVYIRNVKPSSNGRDPETIESAYKNYERTKNTFETLVSLRDYNNFILTSDQVSNGFVCDRSNDVQASSKIVTTDGEYESIISQTRLTSKSIIGIGEGGNDIEVTTSEPELTPFDLRIYALKYVNPITTEASFDLSFELATSSYLTNLKDDMDDIKCIQHDFKELADMDIINIQLRYPIYAKIIPYNKLDTLQQLEIQSNIAKALRETLNSGALIFGEEIDYDKVYDVIMESDKRIKSLILDDFDYEAYLVFTKDGIERSIKLAESFDKISDTGTHSNTTPWDANNNATYEDVRKWCNTIRAKAVLAGVTPLLETPDDNFNFSITHKNGATSSEVGKVTTKSEITLKLDAEGKGTINLTPNESIYLTTNSFITKETYANYVKYFYKVNNDILPNAIYELRNPYTNTALDNTIYTGLEYIAFFWKNSDEEESYHYAKYQIGGEDDNNLHIISPNFKIKGGSTFSNHAPINTSTLYGFYAAADTEIDRLLYTEDGQLSDNSSVYTDNEDKQYTLSEVIAKCDTGTILSGTKSIAIKSENSIVLQHGDKDQKIPDSRNLYWILNESEIDTETNEHYYKLFKSNNREYTLKTGEYLFYSDSQGKTFSMLGPGTLLKASDTMSIPISVKAKSYEEVIYGVNNLLNDEKLWYTLPNNDFIEASEMMYYNIGAESSITFNLTKKLNEFLYEATPTKDPTIEEIVLEINNNNISIELTSNDLEVDKLIKNKWTIVSESDPKKIKCTNLSDFTITYKYEDTTVELPKIDVTAAQWSGHSILNLNASPTKEQTLYYNNDDVISRIQTIAFTKKLIQDEKGNYSFIDIGSDTSISSSDGNNTFQTKYAIEALGGEDLDITAYDMTGARYNNAFYSYTLQELENNQEQSDYNLDLNIQLSGNPLAGVSSININLPNLTEYPNSLLPMLSYKDHKAIHVCEAIDTPRKIDANGIGIHGTGYILGTVKDASENTYSGWVELKSELIVRSANDTPAYYYQCKNPLNTINNASLNTKGLKFFALPNPGEGRSTLSKLSILAVNEDNNTSQTSKIRFLPAIPYKNEDELNLKGIITKPPSWNLFEIIKALDADCKFNYSHKVDNDVLIENPLDPNSFLDKNHPYNKATICRWDYKNSTIKVTNKIK